MPKDTQINLRCDAEELARWKAEADRAGRPLAQWARLVLDQACAPDAKRDAPLSEALAELREVFPMADPEQREEATDGGAVGNVAPAGRPAPPSRTIRVAVDPERVEVARITPIGVVVPSAPSRFNIARRLDPRPPILKQRDKAKGKP